MIDKDKFEKEAKDVFDNKVKPQIDRAKMTAVEWLVSILNKEGFYPVLTDEEINQAKEIERQQMERAFNESRLTHPMIGFKHVSFNEYYNETFEK